MAGSKPRRFRIVLGVTGSIACYKAVDLARYFIKRGANVRVVMTESATRFVSPLTFQSLTHNPVAQSFWTEGDSGSIGHIELADWAEAFVIAPATADSIAKLAMGSAESSLLATALATKAPIIIAPAMNSNMLSHPQTQENLTTLQGRGYEVVEPDSGLLACGWTGSGRLASNREIYVKTMRALGPADLLGKRVVISAGPTREMIDPVRYISNRSSGKMGLALANEAYRRGAVVTLIHGPMAGVASLSKDVTTVSVTSAAEMGEAIKTHAASAQGAPRADVTIMAAAVADYRPVAERPQKIKKASFTPTIDLIENEDILKSLGMEHARRDGALLVGFAVETGTVEELLSEARSKLARKGADMIIANRAEDAFDKTTNQVWIVSGDTPPLHIETTSKKSIATAILDQVVARLRKRSGVELAH